MVAGSVRFPKTTFEDTDRNTRFMARDIITGLLTTYTTTNITCAADEVALIDKIVMRAMTNDAATNVTITVEVNDVALPFHLMGVVDNRQTRTLTIEPKGNMVVNPSKLLRVKASANSVASISIYYTRMLLTRAVQLGLIKGNIPTVASSSALVAATAKKIVDIGSNQAIEILGFYLTGHGYSASIGSIALGFWDGSGTFYTPPATKATTTDMVCVGHNQGANVGFAPQIIVNDTLGCIQGVAGRDLYVQASATLAADQTVCDYVVMYRIVSLNKHPVTLSNAALINTTPVTSVVVNETIPTDLPQVGTINVFRTGGSGFTPIAYTSYTGSTFTIPSTDFSGGSGSATASLAAGTTITTNLQPDVNDPTGSAGQAVTKSRKFWASTITAFVPFATNTVTPIFSGNPPLYGAGTLFNIGTVPDRLVKLRGHVGTYVAGRPATNPAFFGIVGIMEGFSVVPPDGTPSKQLPIAAPLTGSTAVPLLGHLALADSNPDGADVDTSRWVCEADELVPTTLSRQPAFNAIEITAADHVARFQLVWGTMANFKDTGGLTIILAP